MEIGGVALKMLSRIGDILTADRGFEVYPLKISNYNDAVSAPFKLPYDADALAILVLSTPKMFDNAFKPWMQQRCRGIESSARAAAVPNPLEDFMKDEMQRVVQDIEERVDIFHDFDLWPNRKPKILMCTCGHLAGAAYYYQPSDMQINPWTERPFGGYFAFRCVLIFPRVHVAPTFAPPRPLKALHSDEDIKKVIESFNFHWQDATFRDFGEPQEKYNELQTQYFSMPPSKRWALLDDWFS